jgi:hypothetical protein
MTPPPKSRRQADNPRTGGFSRGNSPWLGRSVWLMVGLAACLLGSLAAAPPKATPPKSPTAAEMQAADDRIRAMDQEQLFELRRKRDTFYALPVSRQDELRQLQATIEAHPNRDRLMIVLRRFYSWYRELDPIVQPRIMDQTDLEQRVAAIQALLREQSRDSNILPFSNRDLELVETWVDDFSKARREGLRQVARQLTQSSNANPGADAMIRMMFRGEIEPDALFRRLINFAFAPGRTDLTLLDMVTDEDLTQLYSSFSPEGQTHVPDGRESRLRLLWTLVRRPYASEEDLHKFYVQELSPEQRDNLDRMSPERMNRELRQLYIQKKYQLPPRRGGGQGLPNQPSRN